MTVLVATSKTAPRDGGGADLISAIVAADCVVISTPYVSADCLILLTSKIHF